MRILFLCTGNAYRSPLAEALLKKICPDLDVDSAGLHVAIPIPKEVRDYLSLRSASDFLKEFPESIEEKELGSYDLIVAMEPRHKHAVLRKSPELEERIVTWNIRDPYFEEPEKTVKIFDQIENRIKKLSEKI